jgi:amino acid transporter
MSAAEGDDRGSMGFWATAAIGVGGMVGGGIFAVLGLSVRLAHGGAPLAFAIAGLVALVTAYSYARLSVAFPSQGGTVEFINRAFGAGLWTGAINNLLWLSYVIMLSLYAYAFGSYAASFLEAGAQPVWRHVFTSAIIVLLTAINALNSSVVGELEEWLVAIKLLILLLFVGAGAWSVDTTQIAPGAWSPALPLVAGGMIIFLAYEGFELIANTAQEVRKPKKNLPRAYMGSVLLVIVLYVLVAGVTVGNLSVDRIVEARDYALAEAARPFLGQTGFTLIAVAAMLSTASALNATLYGSMRVSYIIAKEGELPELLEKKVWNQPIEGLFISAAAALLVANLFDVSSISTSGSAGFLMVFAAVNAANARLAGRTHSNLALSILGVVACLGALGALVWYVAGDEPTQLLVPAGMVVLSGGGELVFILATGRRITRVEDAS